MVIRPVCRVIFPNSSHGTQIGRERETLAFFPTARWVTRETDKKTSAEESKDMTLTKQRRESFMFIVVGLKVFPTSSTLNTCQTLVS